MSGTAPPGLSSLSGSGHEPSLALIKKVLPYAPVCTCYDWDVTCYDCALKNSATGQARGGWRRGTEGTVWPPPTRLSAVRGSDLTLTLPGVAKRLQVTPADSASQLGIQQDPDADTEGERRQG